MSKCRMWTKTNSDKLKFGSNKQIGLEWTMNWLGKPFRKKSKPKNRKDSKNQSEIAACEQKRPLVGNGNLVQTKNKKIGLKRTMSGLRKPFKKIWSEKSKHTRQIAGK